MSMLGRFSRMAVRRCVRLAVLPALAAFLLAWTVESRGQSAIFHDDFNNESAGQPPAPMPAPNPPNDSVVLDNAFTGGNDIRVVAAPAGGFSTNSLHVVKSRGFGNVPTFFGIVQPGPHTSGVFTVSWKASAGATGFRFGEAALVDAGGLAAFTVGY